MKFEIISQSAPLIMQGVLTTLKIWIAATLISLLVGLLFGILRCRRLRIPIISPALDVITFILRGVPFFVQLLVVYFVLPSLLDINLSPMVAGVVSLGLCSAAYASQMVRGGINAIADEQWEAAWVLGLNPVQTLATIILPQAFRTILPMMCGEIDMLLKSTAIISAIGVLELTRAGMNIIARDMQVTLVYLVVALIYLGISSILNMGFSIIEKRCNYDFR